MKAVLLALLLAQPANDDPARAVEREIVQRLGKANRLHDDPDAALRELNALLDDPKSRQMEDRSPLVRAYREMALASRARIHLERGNPQAVVEDMTALLDRKRLRLAGRASALIGSLGAPLPHAPLAAALSIPRSDPLTRVDCYQPLLLRAEAFNALDQPDREQADRLEAQKIMSDFVRGLDRPPLPPPTPYDFPQAPLWQRILSGVPGALISTASSPRTSLVVFAVMAPLFVFMGRRQRRDARGTWRRLILVSLALAALQAAPVLATALLLRWRPSLAPWYDPTIIFVTLGVFVFNVFRHQAYLTAVTWQGTREAPPLLDDPAVLARIERIAARLGLAAPVTRVVRSGTSIQTNNAMIAGLAAPTMLLYDGVLYRLSEEECDAIVAHELAHLANHSFWHWVVCGAVVSVAVVAASAFYPVLVAVALGLALWTGGWLILGRRLELDCDRRAARAIGHRRAASALFKIHADQPFRGVMEFLIGAIATHPSRDERLAAIHRDSPGDDRTEVEWAPRLLLRRRIASWCAAALWLAVVAGSLLWGYRWRGSSWPALPLALMEAGLIVLFWLGLRRSARRKRRLRRTRRPWRLWLVWALSAALTGWLLYFFTGLNREHVTPVTNLIVLVSLFVTWLAALQLLKRGDRATKLNKQVAVAIQSNDYPKALGLCEANPAVVAGSTELRYNHALIRAVLGRREEALADLERLRQDDPRFKMTWLLLAAIYCDEAEYERALGLCVELSRELPDEPTGPQAESWLLRRLGRLEEAEARANRALEMDAQGGQGVLTLAAVALDRGDHAAARELWKRAERLSPGTVGVALFEAELALATDDPGAEAALERAAKATRNNPLAFAEKAAARLARRLEERRRPSPDASTAHVSESV
jgi:Zn-dependent protease with chaperone function/tetratricopeptide (TPR) repeat protein